MIKCLIAIALMMPMNCIFAHDKDPDNLFNLIVESMKNKSEGAKNDFFLKLFHVLPPRGLRVERQPDKEELCTALFFHNEFGALIAIMKNAETTEIEAIWPIAALTKAKEVKQYLAEQLKSSEKNRRLSAVLHLSKYSDGNEEILHEILKAEGKEHDVDVLWGIIFGMQYFTCEEAKEMLLRYNKDSRQSELAGYSSIRNADESKLSGAVKIAREKCIR